MKIKKKKKFKKEKIIFCSFFNKNRQFLFEKVKNVKFFGIFGPKIGMAGPIIVAFHEEN